MREYLERAAKNQNLTYRELHVILDALPVPVSWATIPDGDIRFTNRAFRKLFGYSETDFPTVDSWIGAYPNPAHREQTRGLWENLWKARDDGIGEVHAIEVDVACADGSIRNTLHRGIILHEINVGIATFEDITDRKNAEKMLRRMAFEDPLTGLPNRRLFKGCWSKKTSAGKLSGQTASILMIDLDGFKQVNDQFGHDAGDAVLQVVAERLRTSIRQDDLICRIGGDEFAIMLPNLLTFEHVERLCQRIANEVTKPIDFEGHSVSVGASIGASIYPQDATDLETLLRYADEALYRVKTTHKGGWEWFTPPLAA